MELNFGYNVWSNDRLWEDACEVLCQSDWVYSLNVASRLLSKLWEGIKVALVSNNWDNVYSHSLLLCKGANALIKFFNFEHLLFWLSFIKSSEANIGKAISADDYLRTWCSLSCHSNWCSNSWPESSWSSFFETHQFLGQLFLGLVDGMIHAFFSLLLSILNQVIIIHKFVTSNHLGVWSTIAYHSYLVVEWHKAKLSIRSSLAHVLNLLIDCRLQALHATHISDILFA